MKHIRKYENYSDIDLNFYHLIKGLSNLSGYEYIDDTKLTLSVKSGSDRSKYCPEQFRFLVVYNIKEDYYTIKNIDKDTLIGDYYLREAIDVINYEYRNY